MYVPAYRFGDRVPLPLAVGAVRRRGGLNDCAERSLMYVPAYRFGDRVPLPLAVGASPLRRRGGLGDFSFGKAGTGVLAGATSGINTALSTGNAIAGGVAGGIMAIAPFTGPAAPFLAAAAALVAPIAMLFKGCGQSCVQATQYANQAATMLDQLKASYFAQPVRYASTQKQVLAYMDQTFSQLQQACSSPSLGDAGRRCIAERLVKGGSAPWCPTKTGCDWITAYRDPVANDTGVVADPDVVSSVLGGLGGDAAPVLAIVALLALAAVL